MSDARGLAVQAVALRALAERVDDRLDDVKAELRGVIGPNDRTTARLDNGTAIGTVTYTNGRVAASVVDPAAFLAWVRLNHPDEIVQAVRDSFRDAVLATCKRIGAPVNRDGEVIPGVRVMVGDPYLMVRPDTDALVSAISTLRANLELVLATPTPPAPDLPPSAAATAAPVPGAEQQPAADPSPPPAAPS
jgi:hypothetical protein